MITFDKIVKKMCEKKGNILTLLDIQKAYFTMDEKGRVQAYKLISRLKANDILLSIRNGVYYVKNNDETQLVDVLDDSYWNIIRAIISQENLGQSYCIVGEKPLGIHMRDYSAPELLVIYTQETSKTIRLSPAHSIKFCTVISGKSSGSKNAFTRLLKFSVKVDINGVRLTYSNREFALLEYLSHGGLPAENQKNVEKFLRKYEKSLDKGILAKLVEIRYITAMNRLRALTKDLGMNTLYRHSLDIIAREGKGCFLTVKANN